MQTDINPNFGVTNTNKVTAWHRINIVSYLIMHRIHWFLSPLLTQTRLSSSLMLLTQASQWLSYISSIFKSNRKRFPCLHSLKKHKRGWENSRQLHKPKTKSRVCITVSKFPNPSSFCEKSLISLRAWLIRTSLNL